MARRNQRNGQAAAKLRRQRSALARFSGHALRTDDLDGLLQEATALVSEAIEVELVKVLQLLPDDDAMLVRAGVNWNEGVVGRATFGAHERSPGGYALQTDGPVISNSLATETRFEIPQLLIGHGVVSMVNVVIRGEGAAWGVLEVDARQPREFDEDDTGFLQNYANVLAAAIERLEMHRELATARRRTELLLAELQHRVKNLLANVQALARRTRKSSRDLDEFAAAFEDRLAALARTQDLLIREGDTPATLDDILRQELEAHGAKEGERFALTGPHIELSPRIAQALGFAFHELATNASKHGALGSDHGRVEVTWSLLPAEDHRDLTIRWRERGVTIEGAPKRRGFGLDAIEDSLPFMLDGCVRLEFRRTGLECRVRFPVLETDETAA